MSENRARTEESELSEPRDRRLAVTGEHLVELDDRLRGVERDRAAALVGGILGRAQELRCARVDLSGREAAADEAPVRAVPAVVERQRPRQSLASAVLVPLPVDTSAVLREPPSRSEGEPEVHPEADVPRALQDVVSELADLQHGRDASAEQLGHREIDARAARRLVLGAVADRQGLEESRAVELGPPVSSMNDRSSGEPAMWA